mgnify:FL=1
MAGRDLRFVSESFLTESARSAKAAEQGTKRRRLGRHISRLPVRCLGAMTSEVMVVMTASAHCARMKKHLVSVTLVGFLAYSSWVVVRYGYLGFLSLAFREPWAMQMLLDLSIALFLVGAWMRRDARERSLPVVPYLALLPLVGAIGALAYLVHRTVVDSSSTKAPVP